PSTTAPGSGPASFRPAPATSSAPRRGPGMRTDLAVIGAGPAGLAGALAAHARGVRVTLGDAAPAPGGQFHRQPASGLRAARPQALHHQWRTWTRLHASLAASTVRLLTDHHVWCVERVSDGRA